MQVRYVQGIRKGRKLLLELRTACVLSTVSKHVNTHVNNDDLAFHHHRHLAVVRVLYYVCMLTTARGSDDVMRHGSKKVMCNVFDTYSQARSPLRLHEHHGHLVRVLPQESIKGIK